MSKTPKVPWGSMSPFEKRLQRPSLEIRAEEVRAVQGCGDPNCPICLPKNGRQGDTRTGGGDMNEREEYYRMRAISKEEMFTPFNRPATPSALSEAREPVADYILTTPHDLSWDSVIGNEAAREALIEAIEAPLVHKELYTHYGMKPLKGVLLWGPPGCGKTMFAKAAASVISRLHGKQSELLLINGPAIQSPFVGVTEKLIRDIFAYAREYRKAHGHPLTIFIDEADAILMPRENSAMWNVANVSTFLTEMDGMENSGAFVMLATNRPESIDDALLRDGRCDRKIKVERPSLDAIKTIMWNTFEGSPHEDRQFLIDNTVDYLVSPHHIIDSLTIGSDTYNFTLAHIISGALVVGLVHRAKGIAFRRDLKAGTRTGILAADLTQAVNELLQENLGLSHAYARREFVESLPKEVKKSILN